MKVGKSLPGEARSELRRDIGVLAAMMVGIGSIVGTGVFVSIGMPAGLSGQSGWRGWD